ncbi:MAG: guanylate kinase [Pseudomonadota bacterium]
MSDDTPESVHGSDGGTPLLRRGVLLVVSSPSGAGKTTLAKRLLTEEPAVQLSVSCTTRPPRPGERNGIDYTFMSPAEFSLAQERGEFLEHAVVFDNRYGTPRQPVEDALAAGRDVLFDIDWQGARQLRAQMDRDIVSVFILPPSAAALAQRLAHRGSEEATEVARRMAEAGHEMSHWDEYDYVIVNAVVDDAVDQLRSILAGERQRRFRTHGLSDFVEGMRRQLETADH